MAMQFIRWSWRSIVILEESTSLGGCRAFATQGGKGKKGGAKEDAAVAGTNASSPLKPSELVTTTVIGANIYRDGEDPKILPDSEYPEWLWRLLDKAPTLGELKRKKKEDLTYEELKRLVKLDNRARIKEQNAENSGKK